jgi:deazaflavin-dependent oxidoreductase (nitroreductase family)
MNKLNAEVIKEFRENRGTVTQALGGHFKDTTLAIVHYVDRTTGKERETPLLCVPDGHEFLLVGSNGGTAQEPLWVADLEAMSETTLEFGEQFLRVQVVSLREGPAWERRYQRVCDYWPDMHDYEKNANRRFPVFILSPVHGTV